jgi:chaperonin GroES
MILQPIADNVVLKIKDREREEVRQSGLIVMNQGTEQTLRMEIGEVVAVGEGRTLNNGTVLPLSIKAGQQVIYNKYAGTQIMSGEEKFLIVKETDILAIVK